jgi:hypothetical protein
MSAPEESARQQIDEALDKDGWAVQDVKGVNLHASRGVAIREFPLRQGHGTADYLLYVDVKAAEIVEADPGGSFARALMDAIHLASEPNRPQWRAYNATDCGPVERRNRANQSALASSAASAHA